MSLTLRPYQQDATDAVRDAWQRGTHKPVITLPTGTGKTVIFGSIIRDCPGRVLVLAHRDELISQAQAKIRHLVETRQVGRVQGADDDYTAPIVVASVQSLHERRLKRWTPGTFDLVVIDECHHAAAPSYRRILAHLNPPRLLGVTATPFRGDRTTLKTVFDEIVYHLPLREAIRDHWLTDIRSFRVVTDTNLDPVHTQGGDFHAGELENTLNNPVRNALILQAVRQYGQGRRTVVFAAGVQHAHALAALAQQQHLPAAVITGTTPPDQRRAILTQFHDGIIPTLFNVAVLTEGWDEPAIECLILARPTKSLPLFTQIVGRGVRPSPETGKTELTLVDMVDATTRHHLISIHHLIGLNQPVPEGQTLTQAAEREETGLLHAEAFWTAVVPDLKVQEVPDLLMDWILTGPLPAYDWRDIADDLENFRAHPNDWTDKPAIPATIPLTEGQRYTLLNYGWHAGYLPRTAQEASWAIERHMEQFRLWADDRIRLWSVLSHENPARIREQIFQFPWHFKPATDKQLNVLKKRRIPLPPYPLTAGEASWVLDHILKPPSKPTADSSSVASS
jgi:superfamily II DNA or RNA helicase